MIKKYRLENLDCANCAEKMSRAVNKLEGVTSANVSFMTLKMTVEFCEGANVADVEKNILSVCKKVEPDCKISEM